MLLLRTSVFLTTLLRLTQGFGPPVCQQRLLTRLYAAPRSKLPQRRVDISCDKCKARLFRYAKANGAGSQLVKVYHERIVEDHTNGVFVACPKCGQRFAREAMIHGKRAFKIVGGKVHMK